MVAPHLVNHQPKYFAFSAHVAEKMRALAGIYYLARALDLEGKGYSYIDLDAAAAALGKSPKTIYAHLYKACRDGYFWAVQKRFDGSFFVKYKSEARICSHFGIGLGAIARAPFSALKYIKFLIADASVEAIQKTSTIAARHQVSSNNDETRRPVNLDQLFGEWQTCEESRGGSPCLAVGERFTYLASTVIPVGGKQETAAHCLGLHRSTMQRRLSKSYRESRGVDDIDSTQLAIRTDVTPDSLAMMRELTASHADCELAQDANRHFCQTINGVPMVFYACCNVYNSHYVELTRQRHKRKKLKNLLEKNLQNEPILPPIKE